MNLEIISGDARRAPCKHGPFSKVQDVSSVSNRGIKGPVYCYWSNCNCLMSRISYCTCRVWIFCRWLGTIENFTHASIIWICNIFTVGGVYWYCVKDRNLTNTFWIPANEFENYILSVRRTKLEIMFSFRHAFRAGTPGKAVPNEIDCKLVAQVKTR